MPGRPYVFQLFVGRGIDVMKTEGVRLAFCDGEREYLDLMAEYLRKNRELPWEICAFSGVEELQRAGLEQFVFFVVAESMYGEVFEEVEPSRLILLSESGLKKWESLTYVDKYQPAAEVLRSILLLYAEVAEGDVPRLRKTYETKFIGFFTPVRRSLQTSFALTMSQILARDHPTLYLNFEPYAGLGPLLPDFQTADLSDLLYFLDAPQDRFRLRMQILTNHLGSLDYVSPMKMGTNLLTITVGEWLTLFRRIEELGEYEYVVLDLSEAMQGIFQLLHTCRKVITLTREDSAAAGKLLQYEQLLNKSGYADVQEKTKRVPVPHIRNLPEDPELLTRGELANLVQRLVEDLE